MKNKEYILGIDTSNYKTSVAVIDSDKNIICDLRRFLKVKQGEKGLRQSDALFQHIKNLPELMKMIRESFSGDIAAIAYSSKPRPAEGSYMPVFLAGEGFGKSIAEAMKIPAIGFSHQEGHIEAIKAYSVLMDKNEFLACHFSGGTCEVLKVTTEAKSGYSIEIIGGSKDISLGQVLDRAGVSMGLGFPSGEEMDKLASIANASTKVLTPIKVTDCKFNLSGIDTQIKRVLEIDNEQGAAFMREIFEKLSAAVSKMLIQASQNTGIYDILMAGGVSSSKFMRTYITAQLEANNINPVCDSNDLSQDNAVGTALLGGKYLWD